MCEALKELFKEGLEEKWQQSVPKCVSKNFKNSFSDTILKERSARSALFWCGKIIRLFLQIIIK